MNAEHKAKLKEGRAKARTSFAGQVVKVDEHWTVRRADELNWMVEYKGKFHGFYGTILSAFKALPAKMVSEEAKTSLANVMECQKAINERIERSLWDAKSIVKQVPIN